MTSPSKCVVCRKRVPAAGDRCAHCWRERAELFERMLAELIDRIFDDAQAARDSARSQTR